MLTQGVQRFLRRAAQSTAAIDVGRRQFVETLRPPRTQIEDARFFRMVEKVQIDLGHIADIDEIALLFAIGVTVAALEKPYLTVSTELVVMMKSHRGHAPFVRFPRAIDVEVAESDHL